eukprot:gb/GEZN01009812.1/.p1 GENE.gb/GEZN01009812.1/~~gb/GEZN01009812.1/.p1  ORF type:complete len:250 (-),score=53.32 gb/GEZN01009812.1/:543-1229(-)
MACKASTSSTSVPLCSVPVPALPHSTSMFSSTVPAPTLPQPLSSTPFLSSTSSTTTTSSSSSSSFSSSSCFSSSCLSTPAASLLACLGCSRKRCAGSCFPPCLLEHAGTTAAGPVGARLRKGTLLAALELLARRLGWAYAYNRLLCQRLPAQLSRRRPPANNSVPVLLPPSKPSFLFAPSPLRRPVCCRVLSLRNSVSVSCVVPALSFIFCNLRVFSIKWADLCGPLR